MIRVVVVVAVLALGGAAQAGVTVSDGWSRATFGPGGSAIGFLTIGNDGAADALLGASCTGAGMVALHDEKSGTMMMPGMAPMRTDSMPMLDRIEVPAHGRVVLQPGGMHLMMMNMQVQLSVGQQVACVLRFRDAGAVPVSLRVGRAGATTAPR